MIQPFNDEQARVSVNLAAAYTAMRDARRGLSALGPSLVWKSREGREYLYTSDASGSGTSLGVRSAGTESRWNAWRASKEALARDEAGARETLAVQGMLARTLRLPAIGSAAASILRTLDELRMLESSLLVVGTNALAAYELEGAARFAAGMDATEDFDLAWSGAPTQLALTGSRTTDATLFAALKRADASFTVNSERTFQARNSKAFEVELLVAPSQLANLSRDEKLVPLALPEQEWLLPGRRVDQVVAALDGSAARIVAPDPRWMALHKLWLADKPSRNPLKREKDRRQGEALLAAVRERMPHYPLDDAFLRELPPELGRYLPARL